MIIIGYKYSSFEEYIQLNYLDEITEAMEEYIKEKELNLLSLKLTKWNLM